MAIECLVVALMNVLPVITNTYIYCTCSNTYIYCTCSYVCIFMYIYVLHHSKYIIIAVYIRIHLPDITS